MRHRLGLATRTQISICKSPFPSAGTAVSLFRDNGSAETTVAEGGRNLVAGLWGHTSTFDVNSNTLAGLNEWNDASEEVIDSTITQLSQTDRVSAVHTIRRWHHLYLAQGGDYVRIS